MSDITEEDVMKYCQSRNLMLVTKESLEYMHRPIVIENAPTVKAIPVEWIEEYAKSLIIKRRFLAENGFRDNRCYDYMFGIIGMLDDWDTEIWEKENDTN